METFVAELTVFLVMGADRVSYEFPLRDDVLETCLAKEERAASARATPAGDVVIHAPRTLPMVVDEVRAMSQADREAFFRSPDWTSSRTSWN